MNFIVYFITCFLIQITFQQEHCNHPTNYSDFNLLLINNTLVATGGNSKILEVWTLDLLNGLNTSHHCWQHIVDPLNSNFSSFTNGIGFPLTNRSFMVQAGDHASTSMMNLSLFDLDTHTWSKPLIKGIPPEPRSRMSVSINETTNVAWFYGGRKEQISESTNYFNSFYNLDLNRLSWNWPEIYYSGGQRFARYGHSSNLISERLFIMGGKTALYSNEWKISTGDFQSILIYDTITHQSISMATIGHIPPARYSFSTVNAPDGISIVLFGGQNISSETSLDATNHVYVLDTCTLNWTQPIIKGTPPIPRAGHEAIQYQNRYMIIMMGIQGYSEIDGPIYINDIAILDMIKWEWISSIPKEDNEELKLNHCKFNFPVVIPSVDNSNTNEFDLTKSISAKRNDFIKKLILGIIFGSIGLLILITGIILFIFRIRRDVDPTKNPRWLPDILKKSLN